VEDPRTAPHVLHPPQSGAPASREDAQHLNVFAVRVGATPQDSTAVLGLAPTSARTYVVGAILENGAEITAIYADRVELTLGEEHHTLYAAGAEPGPMAIAQAADASRALGAQISHPVEAATSSLVRIEDIVRSVPVYGERGIQGFKVYPGSKPDVFARSGLQPQDLIVSVAGQTIQDAAQLAAQLSGLTSGRTIQAEVLRGDRAMQVTLDGSALAN
jgi:general secretion pathway protein C